MNYGLIGEHLGHSFSKEVHSMLGSYNYEIREIARDNLDFFMKSKKFKAINVTIPYKESVIPYLSYISDEAKAIGSVNTIINKNGELYGYNTDFYGMSALISHLKLDIKDKKVVILGTGGTSKTAKAVTAHLGAKTIITVSRTPKDSEIGYDELYREHSDADVVINTTPVGMYPNNSQRPILIDKFTNLNGVIDAIYNPIRTNLVLDARKRGIPAEGGLYMLVAQAIKAAELFLDTEFTSEVLDKAYHKILKDKENIALIGMPASGKSTVGKILASEMSRDFRDTDELITLSAKKTIRDIFSEEGEAAFRDLETEAIASVSVQNKMIIATGGGSILREENVDMLKQNSILFFIDRSLDALLPTADRPLSQSRDDLEKRYNERYPIYSAVADVIIDANAQPDEVAKKIIGGFYK